MNTKLALQGGRKSFTRPTPHFLWPRITERDEKAVLSQLHSSVSIYNRSGVFLEFEDAFRVYHHRQFALLHNSGTNSIYAMFHGGSLGCGDEVIFPTYTFFATASPIVFTGAIPRFVDCLPSGNIDPEKIRECLSSRTRAVVITHMWGLPCDMDEISLICKKYNLDLYEDCSHAHGAQYNGQKVGTFGRAAAWSLQGQKLVTGGEGGILLTNDQELHIRALLLGHYNKRCVEEIPKDHFLHQYSTTGFGLKNRAHPLAISLALSQFNQLDEFLEQKRIYAKRIIEALASIPFLKMPVFDSSCANPAWYAFVMNFIPEKANGVTREEFIRALNAEGLSEIEAPNSTRPIHNFPLFSNPHAASPGLYKNKAILHSPEFPVAESFFRSAIKLPVWAFPDEIETVDGYIEGIIKVAHAVQHEPKSLKI